MELRGVDECDASEGNIGAQLHAKQIRAMVRVVQYDVPPPCVASAVDKPRALNCYVVAVVELNRGLTSVAPIAAPRPGAVQTFCVSQQGAVDAELKVRSAIERSIPVRGATKSTASIGFNFVCLGAGELRHEEEVAAFWNNRNAATIGTRCCCRNCFE